MHVIFKPSGPEHVFKALIKSSYVECHVAGPVEVTPEQAEILLAQYAGNFSAGQKAEKEPASNKAEPKPSKNKSGGGGK